MSLVTIFFLIFSRMCSVLKRALAYFKAFWFFSGFVVDCLIPLYLESIAF